MSRFSASLLAATAAAALAACAPVVPVRPMQNWSVAGTAALQNASGQTVGAAELRQRGSEWALAIGVSGLTPGEHGIHLHEAGRCDGPDFTTAKGHLNPAGKAHGSANPAGMHMGDLPNLVVGADGTASTTIAIPSTVDPAVLFDADGTAIVVHAGPDDYRSDPAGNSGRRIACGIVTAR